MPFTTRKDGIEGNFSKHIKPVKRKKVKLGIVISFSQRSLTCKASTLTHLNQMEFPNLINWTNQLPF